MIALGDATWIALFAMALGFGVLVVVVIAMIRNRDIHAKLGTMELQLGKIELATNDRPADGPTLSREVTTIAEHVQGIASTLDQLSTQVMTRDQAVDARLDQLTARVDDIDTRVTSLTTVVKGL